MISAVWDVTLFVLKFLHAMVALLLIVLVVALFWEK